ncbi:hypothetical protein, partial [Nostoc sp.]|uniref:hypothetical protein n=1 Tax=Nostoc sp. TaxID=1180 RepID=UPI002FF91146
IKSEVSSDQNNPPENKQTKKASKITVESDRSLATDISADIKSEVSSDQNNPPENKQTKKASKITVESDRSPGTDRGL